MVNILIGIVMILLAAAFTLLVVQGVIFLMDWLISVIAPWPPINYNFELEDEDVG